MSVIRTDTLKYFVSPVKFLPVRTEGLTHLGIPENGPLGLVLNFKTLKDCVYVSTKNE